jgi:hypothetical protein
MGVLWFFRPLVLPLLTSADERLFVPYMLLVFDMRMLALAGFVAVGIGCATIPDIHQAARAGDAARVTALLAEDPGLVNAADRAGWTPLHFAAQRGSTDVAELLLARGASLEAQLAEGGGTPLHVAASNGQAAIVDLFLAKGADANVRDANGWTTLHRAAIVGDARLADILLGGGADVNAESATGLTPLEQAAQLWHGDFIQHLRERGGVGRNTSLPIREDFAGDCWMGPIGETKQFAFGCDRRAYRLRLKRPGPVHVTRNFALDASAVSAEIDATVASGRGTEPGAASLGIGCLVDHRRGYVAILRTNGAWAIMRLDGSFTQLAGTNVAGAVPGNGRTNRLRVDCAGASGEATVVRFFVNGLAVGTAADPERDARFNGIALYADTFPGEVVFERFSARAPSD